jgi:hypothetical protein
MRRRRGTPFPVTIFFILFMFWFVPQLFSALGHIVPALFAFGLIAAGAMMLIKRGTPRREPRETYFDNRQTAAPERTKRETSPQSTAVGRALDRAQTFDNDLDVDLLDIGLFVYEADDSHPKIFRLGEVPDNSSHIRPFIVLEPVTGTDDNRQPMIIRFNLLDGNGQLRYTSRSRYRLKSQPNFVTPSTWLPLKDMKTDGSWSLQINIGDGPPIAIHEFRWFAVGGALRAQFDGDGELDERTLNLMQHPTKGLALDDLLAVQEQEVATPIKVSSGRSS